MKEKKWVKYLCLFALTFVLAISAAGAKNVSASTKSGSCGDKATYEYDTSTKTLTISGSGTVEAADDWYNYGIVSSAKKVVIGDKITAIADYTFYYFESLKTVKFGAKVKTIGSNAFGFCEKLTSVTLPSTLKKIEAWAFEGTGLKKVTIPKKVTSIELCAFAGCADLTKIAVSSGNTKYSAKGGVLYNYDKTKLICYPAGKSSSSFTVPGTVTTISVQAFNGTSNLKSISLNKVKKISNYAFSGSGLKKITIPKSVTSIGEGVFEDNKNLTKIAVSSSNTKYSAKDGVLYNKTKTKLIAYPDAKTDTSFTVPSTVKIIYSSAFAYNLNLKKLTISSKVTEIGSYAFFNCSKLKSVSVDAKTIGLGAFHNCSKLKTVVVGANVKTIEGEAFGNCNALTAVRFKGSAPDFGESTWYTDAGEVTFVDAFYGVKKLTIKYPSSEKSSWTKSLRSKLKAAVEETGGTVTFEAY